MRTTDELRLELRGLARTALAMYDVDVHRVRMLPLATNALFRVDTATGPFALRVGSPGWRRREDVEAEAEWVSALARDTSLVLPVPVRSKTGDLIVAVHDSTGRRCDSMLMSWLPGRLLGRCLTAPNLYKLGALFAQLHQHGHDWRPPDGFSQRRFDRVLSRDEPDSWQAAAERSGVSADDVALIRDVHDRVDAAYAALDRSDLRVIHGDMHHDNVMTHNGVLSPFDFEDTVWGYRIHDLAMSLLDLWDDTDPDGYERLFDAFHRGYTTSSSWPAGDLTLFQLGRIVWRLNWTSNHHAARVANAARATAAAFRYTMTTGRLQPKAAH